jgi:hypothetical protein
MGVGYDSAADRFVLVWFVPSTSHTVQLLIISLFGNQPEKEKKIIISDCTIII